MARQTVEKLPLITVDDTMTGWTQPIVPVGIPNQPINNGSESDNDSLPDLVDAPDVEVYVNNFIGDSGNIDDANVGDSVYDDIAVHNDVPVAPVNNDAMETTEVDDEVDDETMQVDDDGIPVTEETEQEDMPR